MRPIYFFCRPREIEHIDQKTNVATDAAARGFDVHNVPELKSRFDIAYLANRNSRCAIRGRINVMEYRVTFPISFSRRREPLAWLSHVRERRLGLHLLRAAQRTLSARLAYRRAARLDRLW